MLTPEQCLSKISWLDQPLSYVPLYGGLGNRVYRVQTVNDATAIESSDLVLRIHNPELNFSVQRQNEKTLWQQAAEAGLAPELLHWADDDSFSVSRYLPPEPDRDVPISARADLVVRIHQLPAPRGEVNYQALIQKYADHAKTDRKESTPTDTAQLNGWLTSASGWLADMQRSCLPVGFCHHDLNPDNLVFSRGRLYCLDFEYAGIGHPLFDLAVLADDLSSPNQQQLLSGYYQQRSLILNPTERHAFASAQKFYWLSSLLWYRALPTSARCQRAQSDIFDKLKHSAK